MMLRAISNSTDGPYRVVSDSEAIVLTEAGLSDFGAFESDLGNGIELE